LSGSGSTAFAVITAGMAYTAEIKYTATGRYFILINDLESLDISDKKREKRLYIMKVRKQTWEGFIKKRPPRSY